MRADETRRDKARQGETRRDKTNRRNKMRKGKGVTTFYLVLSACMRMDKFVYTTSERVGGKDDTRGQLATYIAMSFFGTR